MDDKEGQASGAVPSPSQPARPSIWALMKLENGPITIPHSRFYFIIFIFYSFFPLLNDWPAEPNFQNSQSIRSHIISSRHRDWTPRQTFQSNPESSILGVFTSTESGLGDRRIFCSTLTICRSGEKKGRKKSPFKMCASETLKQTSISHL